MEGGRGSVVLLLLLATLLLCGVPGARGRYLRFEPGFEYQFQYRSDANLHHVDTFLMEARVSYRWVKEVDEGQEIQLKVISCSLTAGRGTGVPGHNWDFSKWFSFVLTPRGQILHVQHVAEENDETLAIKKGLAALLAARLHHHSDQDGVKVTQYGDEWHYQVQELGHEGLHNATYRAKPTEEGTIFTKVRHSHPVAHAVANYTKHMHYHDSLKMFHTIEITEHFDTMADPPEGYSPYIPGHEIPKKHEEQPTLPSMMGSGKGKLQFLAKIHVTETPVPDSDVSMVTSTIHVGKVKKAPGPRIKLTKVTPMVVGNLTCMRQQTEPEGSRALQECFHALVGALTSLSDSDITAVTQSYLGSGSRLRHMQSDRKHMVDALWSVKTEHAQNEVTKAVLGDKVPVPAFVERLLYLIGGDDDLPPEYVIQTLVTMTLKPEQQAPAFRSGDLRHRLILVMGTIIRRMQGEGYTERAAVLASTLQNMLGIHNADEFRRKRSTMTEKETIEEDLQKVVLLESLGNARMDQSYGHILSHLNDTNSQWVKRAAIHALRDYHHEHAANVILMAAMYDEHETVRYESYNEYQRHPKARQLPKNVDKYNTTNYMGPAVDDVSEMEHPHERRQRDLFDEWAVKMQSPSVKWLKILGSKKIGASFGLIIKNLLDLKISLLSGHAIVDVHDEAYGQVNLGFMGFNVDIMRLRLCFRGQAKYNLNLLQEFDVKQIERTVERFDRMKKQTVDAITDGIQFFRDLLEGNTPIADIIKAFVDAIKKLPEKILIVGMRVYTALERISTYDDKQLPPFMVPLKNLVLKIANLVNDIKTDVIGFCNRLMTAVVVIPCGGNQIFESVENIIHAFEDIQKNPLGSISTVTGSTLTIGVQVKLMTDAVKDVKEAAFFAKKEKPYWWDLRGQVRILKNMSQNVARAIEVEGPKWVKTFVKGANDKIDRFTRGNMTMAQMKGNITKDLKALPELVNILFPLENLGDDVQNATMDLFELVVRTKKAYVRLRNGTRMAKQLIEKVFGPKAHKKFPRTTRLPGGNCGGKGFYPGRLQSTVPNTPEYTYDGVDLMVPEDWDVVAPFPGIISLSDRPEEVIIESRGSPKNVDFILTNIRANSSVRHRSDPLFSRQEVVAGQVIGRSTRSPCDDNNHIHFAIRKGKGTVNPTRFLNSRLPTLPLWKQFCDDYKYVYKARTLAAGTLVGLMGRKKNDTSPPRTADPALPPQLLADRNPKTKLQQDTKQPNSLAKNLTDNMPAAAAAANNSTSTGSGGDSLMKTLFNSALTFLRKFNLKDMKLGNLAKFLSTLKMEESLNNMTVVFRTIQDMVSNKPCKNPNSMSNKAIRAALKAQGKPSNGSRYFILKLLTKRSDKCPMLSLGLPPQMYCVIDDQCLGLECCLDVKLMFFRKTYKMYARYDPCNTSLAIGMQEPFKKFEKIFGPEYGLDDIVGGFDETLSTGIKFDMMSAEMYVRVQMEKEDKGATLSFDVKFCKEGDPGDCLITIPVLNRVVMPVPVCGPDGTVYAPTVNLKKVLKNQKDKFRKSAKQELTEAVTDLADRAVEHIPCLASQDDEGNLPCARPESMSEETLTSALESRGLSTSGSDQERKDRLETADRSCTFNGNTLTLPAISDATLAEKAYVTVDDDCQAVETCMEVPISTSTGSVSYKRSVRARMKLEACVPTFHINFESCQHEVLLFNSTMSLTKDYRLSDLYTLKASIIKSAADTAYRVGLGMRVLLHSSSSSSPPYLDTMLIDSFDIPIPTCTDYLMPGNGSLASAAAATRNVLTPAAVNFFLKTLKLDTILTEGSCTTINSPSNCGWNIDVSALPNNLSQVLTCGMTYNCQGITCCLDVEVAFPLMARPLDYYLPFHFTFDPCDNMKVDVAFGAYTRAEYLLNYDFGQARRVTVGVGQYAGEPPPLNITYSVEHYRTMDPYDEGYQLDLNVNLCIPFDGQTFCLPDTLGIDVMSAQRVPVCSPISHAEISSFNLTQFLVDTSQPVSARSLPQSVSQMLLTKFGLPSHMRQARCDRQRAPYTPALDGWRNECPEPTQQLPKLPANAACHLSAACNRVDCCVYSEFLDTNVQAWFQLNCDLFLQAGVERLISPKHFVMGGEVDWNLGITGSVNISEAFRIEYKIRKDALSYVIDADVKLCFDTMHDTCQLALNVMKDTKIPRLGCNPGAVSYFNDLFTWQQCFLPDGDTGCHVSLPASLLDRCVQTNNCLSVQCCLPVDLGFLGQHSISASFHFDRCSNTFVYTMDKKSGSLGLSAIVDVPQTEQWGSAITFNYQVKSTPSGYDLEASLDLCALDNVTSATATCATYDLLPDDVSIYSPAAHCTGKRRRRRSVARPKYDCSNSPLNKNDLMLHMIEKENATVAELEQCMAVFKKQDKNKCNKMKNQTSSHTSIYSPKGIMGGLGTQNPSSLMFCSKHALISLDIEGANIIAAMLGSREIKGAKGRHLQPFVPGGGLTENGNKALATKIANMTIAQMQAYVLSEGIDPERILDFLKDLKDVLQTLYCDVVTSITESSLEDMFKSFDLALNGDFSVPRQTTNFFEYKQFFLVGGLVPMTFEFTAGITTSMKVLVKAKMLKLEVTGTLVPYITLRVQGTLSVGALMLGQLRLTGYICQLSLPSQALINFSKFPMDVSLTIDLDLKPLELKLAALVTVEVDLVFEKITKVLFQTNLFHYETPTISKRVLHVGKNEPDRSPPQFDNFELDKPSAGRRRRSPGTTNACFVRQLPGLDYSEPSIEIGFTATDDKSQPQFMVYAGTKPGLKDLLTSEMGGSSTIIREVLDASTLPVYFTVKAENSGGGASEVTCSIDAYDVTLPTGRLEAEFRSSSNQHVLHGRLVVYEDSPLTTVDLGVGLGKGAYAGGVRAWEPINLGAQAGNTYDAASDPVGHAALENHFTDFKEGRLAVPSSLVTRDTHALFVYDCAKQCVSLPSSKCMSFNFHSRGHCELLQAIEGHDHSVSVATNYLHYERIGVGMAHEFKLDVPMVHNSLYFLNLFMENSLQFINTISSEGTIIDLTSPLPGPMNITNDTYEIVPCADNLPSDRSADWLKWCRGIDPLLPNHRILEDGANSATIFNGHERMHDLLYTKANRYVSANWDGIHDYESGILGYTLTVGREVCEEWLHPHHDPHRHLVPIDDDEQWTHIGVVNTPNGASLPDRKYYVTLRTLNEVQYGGTLATSFCHKTAYAIDTSPPIVEEVYGTTYDEETNIISSKFNASDPHSDILDAAICLGRSVLNCDLLAWETANTSSLTEGPAIIVYLIADGVPAWVRLRVENGVELQAIGHALHPIIVDMSPPLPGTVFDGPISKHDLAFSKDENQYCANWYNFTDPNSGIAFYMGAVVDAATGDMMTNLTMLDRRAHVTCMTFGQPALQHNVTYRFLLYAFNAGHKQLNVSAESDGVLIDLTAPETGQVVDGTRDNFQDMAFSVHQATVGAQWRNFRDPESGILHYDVEVERASNLSSNFQVIQNWDNVALANVYESHHYHLHHRDVVRTKVKATNGALNAATAATDAFIVDMTPPDLLSLWDGLGSADVDYQKVTNQLSSTFEFVDEESGVDHYKYQIFQTMHGHRSQIVPATRNTWVDLGSGARTSITATSLTLTPGLKYSMRVAAVNQAGSVATYDTDGVIVDPTPPVLDYVYVGVLSSEEEVLVNGFVLQNDQSGIKATWLGTDHESGVTAYEVAVGTSAGGTDTLTWRNVGGERDGYIGGLSLQLTDNVSNTPVYYVSVRAVNGAGDVSSPMTSNPIKILQEDAAGIVMDGATNTVLMTTVGQTDVDHTLDRWSVTAQFSGYTSHLHGLSRFDWAVGSSAGGEDLMPFTVLGIQHDEAETSVAGNGIASRGVAQTVLPLQPGTQYYTTVRAFNNDGQAVQSVSDGFSVDDNAPALVFISLSKESNSSALPPEAVLFQSEPDALSAEWTYSDTSGVTSMQYAIGTYPGASDVIARTDVTIASGSAALPSTAVYLNTNGRPNLVTLWAENSVGLKTQVVSPSVIADVTPPIQGVITCPSFVQTHSQVECRWSGFMDPESVIQTFTFSVGTAPGLHDVMSPVTLDGYVSSYPAAISGLSHNMKMYVTIEATNALGLNTSATSSPIATDTTPPVPGVVVELSDKYVVISDDDNATVTANNFTCVTEDECMAFDVTCQESMTTVFVAWTPFEDPETSVVKYEVAVGTSAGGGQLRTLEEVPSGQTYHMVEGLNLMGQSKIYVTVKGTNGAGASTTATSNGVYMSYLSQGLAPPGPVVVFDGDNPDEDLDYQTSLMSISARWTTDGDACPAVTYEWAIMRVDGQVVYDFYDTNGKTTALNDALLLRNLETYHQLVRVTNALGYTYTLRSDGITVNQDPLIPGEVFDGDKTGYDLNYLADYTKVSANWQGFGDVAVLSNLQDPEMKQVDANAIEEEDKPGNQQVIRYLVALGTDRRFDNSRDNIVPWTDVGTNTSVTFFDLDLTPRTATYYFTVRAISASFSKAEVTSNGFRAGFDNGVRNGRVEIQQYLNTNLSMEVSWDSFYSDVGMFIYYVAISSAPVSNLTCQAFTDGGGMSVTDRQALFDVSDRLSAGEETYASLGNLSMIQDTDVYVHVIAVDRAGLCRMITEIVHIDITPPIPGQVKVGPYYNESLTFAPNPLEVTVDWTGFEDQESPMTSYTLELMTQAVCDVNTPPGGSVLMTVEVGFNLSSYTFLLEQEGQSLISGQPYFVRVNAFNAASLNTSVISAPFVFDDSLPVIGHVVDGTDFLTDRTWSGSNTTASASILLLPTPSGPACPSRDALFTGTTWSYLTTDRAADHSGRSLDLLVQPDKVTVVNDTMVTLTLTRDTNQGWMYGGTVLTPADLVRGGTYEMDIQAANGDGNAVTSVTLWDGDTDNIVHYDFTYVVEEEFCMCCFDSAQTASPFTDCMSACSNCTEYVANYMNRTVQVSGNVTRRRRSADEEDAAKQPAFSPSARQRRSVAVQSLSAAEIQQLQSGSTLAAVNAAAAVRRMPACGLQIYTLNSTDPDYVNGSLGRLVAWCTFGTDNGYEPKFVARSVTFDPSAEFHHYKLDVYQTADESASPTTCLAVFLDHDPVYTVELCGLPELGTSTRLALSVWNWKNFLTHPNPNATTSTSSSGIALWQTSATFSSVQIPATTITASSSSFHCRYGDPFRGGQNPIVRFEAGVGSQEGSADVAAFREVYSPCFPCVHNCDSYICDPTCDPTITSPLTFTLSGLDLPTVANESNPEYIPAVYYFTVKAMLGSGLSVTVSSDGFSVDMTAPVVDLSTFFYLDAAQGQSKPVNHLFASNSTIQAIYRCTDNESDVVDYQWAIGTTPGGEDIQNYVSTGLNPTGKNDQLLGVITHNTRYYVSFKCTNGAGLVSTYEEPIGVTAFIGVLTVTDVGGDLENSSPIGSGVVPATARKSSSGDSVAVRITISQDPSVDLYYLSIGSTSATRTDDILPRTAVAHDVSGEISIHSGNVYKDGTLMFPLSGIRQGFNGSLSSVTGSPSDFHLEPGRELFAYVDSCNEATCTGPQLVGSLLVVTPHSYAAVTPDGTALHVGLTAAARGKRSADDRASRHVHPRVKRSADQVFVETPGGLQTGQAVMLTQITSAELTSSYDSVASTSFVSYLTDPTYTLTSYDTVDRILVGRATYNSARDVAFSLASVGQLEMPGPVKVTYQYDPNDPDNTVQLLHWNPDAQKWQLSSETCQNETNTLVLDPATSTATVKVCDTYGSSTYFHEQTLFLLPTVSNTILNSLPTLTSPTAASMQEDQGTLVYQVDSSDAELDVIVVTLDSPSISPTEGTISLTPTNLLLYTPCADCYGTYEARLVLTETAVPGIPANTVSATVTITVTAVNDAPFSFAFHKGSDILNTDSTTDIVVLMEQNRVNQTEDYTYTLVFGSYDVDVPSNLTITVESPSYGALSVSAENSSVPECSASVDVQDDTIPCHNMTLPYPAGSLTWRYVTLTYRPDNYTFGYDYLRLMATDEGGLGSLVTTVKFAVMEMPCENGGTCVSKSSAYTCEDTLRAEWFDRYYVCNCTDGFRGLHCSGDIDDCLGSPCQYPYVCVDGVNGYSCECASDNVACDGLEGWMVGVIVVGCVLLVALVVLGVLVWAVRTGRLKLFGKDDKEQTLKILDQSEENSLPRHKAKGSMFITPPKMLGAAPVVHAIKKRTSSTSDLISRSSSSSSPSSPSSSSSSTSSPGRDNPAFQPESRRQSDPAGSSGSLVSSLQNPAMEKTMAAGAIGSLTQGLTLRPRKISTNTLPTVPDDTTVDFRSVSQVSVHVNTPRGRQRWSVDSSRRSSDSTTIGSEPSSPRPITPVEMQEKEPEW